MPSPVRAALIRSHMRHRGARLALACAALALLAVGCERKPCARDCEWFGLCTERAGACVAATDTDCHGSKGCESYGKCSAKAGKCQRLSAADCKRSNKCAWAGECGFKDGECTALSEADCTRARFCKDKGFCRLKKKRSGLAVCVK